MEKVNVLGAELINGDSIEILPTIKEKFDCCISDPPYNISGYDNKRKIGWLKTEEHWSSKKNFNKLDEKWDSFMKSAMNLRLPSDWH